uniref:Uncharacterized protein n=1 Tax=Anguilla anguilla TaxID=7936 RepID=A0A0E9XNE9_ANGAN
MAPSPLWLSAGPRTTSWTTSREPSTTASTRSNSSSGTSGSCRARGPRRSSWPNRSRLTASLARVWSSTPSRSLPRPSRRCPARWPRTRASRATS